MSLAQPFDLDEAAQSGSDGVLRLGNVGQPILWKMAADVAIASILLIISAPLILILMLAVKATSRGPAIFKQVRLGRGGRSYQLYKIRSMANDCEKLTGPQWAKARDPRVTPLGRFLRSSHLDELPQLWNVIRGDMSLVGPRPGCPEFVAQLERAIPDYRSRLDVLPGITGLAQVQLPPDEDIDDVCRKVACDIRYIQEMGLVLDLKIVIATVMKVIGFSFAINRQFLNLPGVGDSKTDLQVPNSAEPLQMKGLQST